MNTKKDKLLYDNSSVGFATIVVKFRACINKDLTIYDYHQYSVKELNDIARHNFVSLPIEERHRISKEHKQIKKNKPNKYFNGKTKITF